MKHTNPVLFIRHNIERINSSSQLSFFGDANQHKYFVYKQIVCDDTIEF